MADAKAASRPPFRFIWVKSEERQARAMLFRTRQVFVRQCSRTSNALRAHRAKYGVTAPKNRAGIHRLMAASHG